MLDGLQKDVALKVATKMEESGYCKWAMDFMFDNLKTSPKEKVDDLLGFYRDYSTTTQRLYLEILARLQMQTAVTFLV